MKTNSDNPRLSESLRQTYRSGKISPYLAQRVIANVKSENKSSRPWLKLASGVFSIAVIVFVVNTINNPKIVDTPSKGSAMSVSLELPAIAATVPSVRNLNIPSLSSLNQVPSLNRINPPATSLYNPGDICIYQQSGEMSC